MVTRQFGDLVSRFAGAFGALRPARLAAVFVSLSLLLPAGELVAQQRTLGKHKGRIVTSRAWTRRILNKDLGRDQFVYVKKGGFFSKQKVAYAIIMELEQLLESTEDFRRALDMNVSLGHKAPIAMDRNGRYLRATRRFEAKQSGINLAYRVELVSRNGLCYLFLCWTLRNAKDTLDSAVDELLKGFRFPPANSAWARQLTPVRKRISLPGYEMSFEYRPFILRPQPPDDGMNAKLVDPSEDRALFIYVNEDYASADAMLDAALRACSDGDDTLPTAARRDFTVGKIRGRRVIGFDAKLTYDIVALPLSGRRFLELRFVSSGGPKETRADRDLLHKTLRLAPRTGVLNLPEPEHAFVPPSQAVRSLLEHSENVAEWDGGAPTSCTRLPDGKLLIIDNQRAFRLSDSAKPTLLFRAQSWGIKAVVPSGDQFLAAKYDGSVNVFRSGAAQEDANFSARAIARWGKGYLLARSRFGTHYEGGADVVVARDENGREHQVAEFPDMTVQGVHPTADQRHVLVVTGSRPTLRTPTGDHPSTQLLDVGARRYRELAQWEQIQGVGVASTGWLVTGRPKARPAGIYHLTTSGSLRPLLLTNDVLGLELDNDELLFWSSERIVPGKGNNLCYRISKADLENHGRIHTLTTSTLDRLGQRFLDPKCQAPGDPKSIAQAVTELRKAALELKAELPREPRDLDRLFQAHSDVDTGGRIVLALVATRCLLDHGFTWVSGPQRPTWLDWCVPGSDPVQSSFAYPRQPSQVLTTALDDGEGTWTPVSDAIEALQGRKGFVGLRREPLQSTIDKATPANLDGILAKPTLDSLQGLLSSHGDNLYLRRMVYDLLRIRERHRLLEQLSSPFAKRKIPADLDVRTWLMARARLTAGATVAAGAAAAAALAEEVLAAVRKTPSDSELVLVLGQLYEKARPRDKAYARACYEHVLRITRYGDSAEKARAALKRLE